MLLSSAYTFPVVTNERNVRERFRSPCVTRSSENSATKIRRSCSRCSASTVSAITAFATMRTDRSVTKQRKQASVNKRESCLMPFRRVYFEFVYGSRSSRLLDPRHPRFSDIVRDRYSIILPSRADRPRRFPSRNPSTIYRTFTRIFNARGNYRVGDANSSNYAQRVDETKLSSIAEKSDRFLPGSFRDSLIFFLLSAE